MEKNNLKELWPIKFRVKLGQEATDTYEKIQKAFVMILFHVLKYSVT
jgi:hypothetical protein